ncbi:TRI25 ligase, partial [Amia calva]|nr:TRI25 ligase [Amia calva]
MAKSSKDQLLVQELSCSICLQLFSEPTSLPCGHSFCAPCIAEVIRKEHCGRRPHTCPECRTEHSGPSALQSNFKLCSIADCFRERDACASSPPVLCDVCMESPGAAAKTCLKCEMSLCAAHLRPHFKAAFQGHVLVEPTSDLRSRTCSLHLKPLEYYCATDRSCVCAVCAVEGEHRSHDVKSFLSARAELSAALDKRLKEAEKKLQDSERIQQEGKEAESALERSSGELRQKALRLLDDIIREAEDYKGQVLGVIELEQRRVESELRGVISRASLKRVSLKEAQMEIRDALAQTDLLAFTRKCRTVASRLGAAEHPGAGEPQRAALNRARLVASVEKKSLQFRLRCVQVQRSLASLMEPKVQVQDKSRLSLSKGSANTPAAGIKKGTN